MPGDLLLVHASPARWRRLGRMNWFSRRAPLRLSSRSRIVSTPTRCRRLVDHVDVEDLARAPPCSAAELVDRLLGRQVLDQGRDLRGHDPAGGVGFELLQPADFVGVVGRELVHQLLVPGLGDVVQDVDPVVGVHRGQHHRRLGHGHVGNHRSGPRRLHPRDDAAGGVGVENLGDVGGLLRREVLHHVRAVGGVDLLDPVGDALALGLLGVIGVRRFRQRL